MGSVFSAPRRETNAMSPQLEEAIAPVGSVQPQATMSPEPLPLQPSQAAPTTPDAVRTTLMPEIGPAQQEATRVKKSEPDAVRTTLMPEIVPALMPAIDNEVEQAAQQTPLRIEATPESILHEREEDRVLVRVADPLQQEATQAEKSERAVSPKPYPATNLKTVARAGKTSTSESSLRAQADLTRSTGLGPAPPDEIQIHIGRIEVTAVPPPARRPVKPQRHEISLDAYLKRRDGRA
jgi:hypothetical protein